MKKKLKTREEKITFLQKFYAQDEMLQQRDYQNLSNKTLDNMILVAEGQQEKENRHGIRNYL